MTHCSDKRTFITGFIEQNHGVVAANNNEQEKKNKRFVVA